MKQRDGPKWKNKEKKKEEKEEDLLKELCGDDAKLYDFLSGTLYLDPMAAISKKDLEILIEEAEKSVEDGNYEEAMRKYRVAMDKAIFEAAQNPRKRGRYTKVIHALASKAAHATEKGKEKVEKEGLADYATSLERRIENYKFMSERIDDVVNVAARFYNEKLAMLEDVERREASREKIRAIEQEGRQEAWGDKERRQARRKKRREARRKELE
jgi:hypothetical protein